MALAGITPTPVFISARNTGNDVPSFTVTPGTGRLHNTETVTLSAITVLGSTGSVTIVDGVVTAATAPS